MSPAVLTAVTQLYDMKIQNAEYSSNFIMHE